MTCHLKELFSSVSADFLPVNILLPPWSASGVQTSSVYQLQASSDMLKPVLRDHLHEQPYTDKPNSRGIEFGVNHEYVTKGALVHMSG